MKKLFLICTIATMSMNLMAFSINFGGEKANTKPAETTDIKTSFKNIGKNIKNEAKAALAKNIDGTSMGSVTSSSAQMSSQIKDSKARKAFLKNLSTCKAGLIAKAAATGLKGEEAKAYMLKGLNGKDVAGIESLAKELKVLTINNDVLPIEVKF